MTFLIVPDTNPTKQYQSNLLKLRIKKQRLLSVFQFRFFKCTCPKLLQIILRDSVAQGKFSDPPGLVNIRHLCIG